MGRYRLQILTAIVVIAQTHTANGHPCEVDDIFLLDVAAVEHSNLIDWQCPVAVPRKCAGHARPHTARDEAHESFACELSAPAQVQVSQLRTSASTVPVWLQ